MPLANTLPIANVAAVHGWVVRGVPARTCHFALLQGFATMKEVVANRRIPMPTHVVLIAYYVAEEPYAPSTCK